MLEDAFAQLSVAGAAKRRLAVTFVNAAGAKEAGIDVGGPMKELLEAREGLLGRGGLTSGV